MKPTRGDKDALTCQLVAVLGRHHHHPVPLDGDGGGRAGQVGDVGDGDHQHVAGSLGKTERAALSLVQVFQADRVRPSGPDCVPFRGRQGWTGTAPEGQTSS